MNDEKKYKCPKCNKKFSTMAALNQHIKVKHKTIRCKFCNKEFENENSLARHVLDGKCKSQKTERNINCSYCNRRFKTEDALKQHVNVKHEKGFICSLCGKGFKKEQSLNQHIKAKHEKRNKIENNKNHLREKSDLKPELGIYEHLSVSEKIRIFFKKVTKNKKIVLLDECVGNNESVINALNNRYQVKPLPNNLISHKDNDLRLAIKEKGWGLVSKDLEMTLKSREAKIKPVYLFKEVRGNRALIKISKRNS